MDWIFDHWVIWAVAAFVVFAATAYEMRARRREDCEEMAPYQPVTDRRPDEEVLPVVTLGGPPDVEPAPAPRRKRAKRSNKRKVRHK